MTGIVPIRPSLAPCSPLSRPLRAASGGGLRPVLTAAVRGVTLDLGRDEETAPPVEQRNYACCQTYLQNSPDATRKRPSHVRSVDGLGDRVAILGVSLWATIPVLAPIGGGDNLSHVD